MKPRMYTAILALLLTVSVTSVHAANGDEKNPKKEMAADMTEAQKAARMEEIKSRVNEIKAMDKSELSRTDRKALRKELKDMNKETRAMKGGVYLSVGAIIIIILLLILIL
jgi:hypothetical protein